MFWKFNMQEYLNITAPSSGDNSYNKTNFENENVENILDNSIMVDPRKTAGYKFDTNPYEIDE